jgi:hypothetical protein
MPAKAPYTLVDNSGTPAGAGVATDRIFTPGEVEKGNIHTWWNGHVSSNGAAQSKITLSLSKANSNRDTDRVKAILSIPQVKTVDGIETVAYTDRAIFEMIAHKDSTEDNRKDLWTLFVDFLNESDVVTVRNKLESMY